MLSKFIKAKNKIYPLFALIESATIFFAGLFFIKEKWFFAYIGAILILLFAFGFAKPTVKVLIIIIPISVIVTLLALIGSTTTEKAFQNGLRTFLFGLSAVISLSIEPIQLVRNLNQLNMPRVLTLGLLIALRFIGVIKHEMYRIRIAMKTRSINNAFYNPKVIYRAFVIPLTSRILSISDMLSTSLETRGFEMSGTHTSYKSVNIKIRDVIFLVSFTLLIIVAVLLHTGVIVCCK